MVRMDTRCQRPGCGRKIWADQSMDTGYGSGCRARVHLAERLAARTEGFNPVQVAKAVEMIEDNAIVLVAPNPVLFRAVSSDGTAEYYTSLAQCTCPASATCYHQVAAAILTAA